MLCCESLSLSHFSSLVGDNLGALSFDGTKYCRFSCTSMLFKCHMSIFIDAVYFGELCYRN